MSNPKFRAWDKKRKEWYGESNPHSLTFYDFHLFGECTLICTPMVEDLQHIEITQYSGVQDRGGKDIYEGDIVVCNRNKNFTIAVNFAGGIFYGHNGTPLVRWHDRKVIGNIFENPELLK